jgi:ribosomal protein S18 acetylase RimI-like enzyme
MLIYEKLSMDNIFLIADLYSQEENIQLNRMQRQAYETRIRKIYQQMLARGSYVYGCMDTERHCLAGAITVNKCLDLYPGYENAPYVHLETLIVHKDFQRQGIGTKLLSDVTGLLKDEQVTYVIMQSDNPYVKDIANKAGLTESLTDMRMNL